MVKSSMKNVFGVVFFHGSSMGTCFMRFVFVGWFLFCVCAFRKIVSLSSQKTEKSIM